MLQIVFYSDINLAMAVHDYVDNWSHMHKKRKKNCHECYCTGKSSSKAFSPFVPDATKPIPTAIYKNVRSSEVDDRTNEVHIVVLLVALRSF